MILVCLHSSYLGRHIFVFSLIYPMCTITVSASSLYFSCCVYVYPWYICTSIASAFIYASFSAIMRSSMLYFTGTTLARIIYIPRHRLENCSTLCCLSPKYLHTLCVLIGLYHSIEKYFPPIHILKALLKNSSCGTEIKIDGPVLPREHTGWTTIVDAIGLIKLYNMAPTVLP